MQSYPDSVENTDECSRALELYSAFRDGELRAEEQRDWLRLQEKYAAEIAVFAAAWGAVEPQLRGLPIAPVGSVIVAGVASSWSSSEPSTSLSSTEEVSGQGEVGRQKQVPRRGWAHQLTAAASLLALGLMVMVLASTGLPSPESAGVGALSDLDVAGDAWRVVVVEARESDREAVLGRLQNFVEKSDQGLTVDGVIASEADGTQAERIVLEGDLATSSSFVSELEEAQLVESPAWDPEAVGEMSRQELIAAVRRSQQTPTLSERHFGLIVVDFPEPPETLIADNRSDAVPAAQNSMAGRQHERARFCVVILEFSKPTSESTADPIQNLL